MKFLRDILDKQKPLFAKGGKYEKFHYLFEAGETFMFVPNEVTPKKGAQIRDAIDLKRLMMTVVIAMIPCLLFGIWNVGHQHFLSFGQSASFIDKIIIGSKQVLPGVNISNLIIIERVAWWIHIIGILLFAIYVSYSKHLHIFLAFPNIYHSNDQELGKMNNMKSITNEINVMMGKPSEDNQQDVPTRFGVKDVEDLSWKNILDAYSCSECGRCTSVCPPNITGKKLSPRKIMMDVRDRAEEIGNKIDKNKKYDDKSLVGDYITYEEIFACTSCNACVEECPLNINPLDIILESRRYSALEESNLPNEWNSMLQNVETNFSPWKFPIDQRGDWYKKES